MGSAASSSSSTSPPSGSAAKFEKPLIVSKKVNDYALKYGFREHPIARELRLETAKHSWSVMMGDPIEGHFFQLLLNAIGAQRIIEVGVYTGYTTLLMAQSIQNSPTTTTNNDNNKNKKTILALDINDDYVSIGKPYWEKAGVTDLIDLRLGPAAETLETILKDEQNNAANSFDFAFIDADKTNYKVYYELLLKLIRPNGIIAIDNVLWSGRVIDTDREQDEDTKALREISEYVQNDDRVEFVLLPFADGVTLVRKK